MVLVFNIRVLFSHLVEDGVEQPIGMLHDIVLAHASYFLTPIRTRVFESIPDDPLTARTGNQLKALNHFSSLLMFNACIQVFLIFPDHDKVHIRKIAVYIRSKSTAGAYVSEKPQRLTNRYIKTLVPSSLRSGDRTFQKDPVAAQNIPGIRCDTGLMAAEVHFFSNLHFFVLQPGTCCLENIEGCTHNFRTDTITESYGDAIGQRL